MSLFKKKHDRFLRSGVSALEYGMLAALIAAVLIVVVAYTGKSLSNILTLTGYNIYTLSAPTDPNGVFHYQATGASCGSGSGFFATDGTSLNSNNFCTGPNQTESQLIAQIDGGAGAAVSLYPNSASIGVGIPGPEGYGSTGSFIASAGHWVALANSGGYSWIVLPLQVQTFSSSDIVIMKSACAAVNGTLTDYGSPTSAGSAVGCLSSAYTKPPVELFPGVQ